VWRKVQARTHVHTHVHKLGGLCTMGRQERIIREAFEAPVLAAHLYDGGRLVSRKKELIPVLTRFLRTDAERRGVVLDDY
jgi:hypothetical protein